MKKNIYFNALCLVKNKKGAVSSKIIKTNLREIYRKNFIIIKGDYSCLNYKDILLLKGNPGLVRKFPHTPGIDYVGKIIFSPSKKYKKNQKVIILARPLGIEIMGGLSQYICVPVNWISKLPSGLSDKKSMMFGTAGFTAVLTILKIIEDKNLDRKKPILIIGGTTGVGLICSIILKHLKYKITISVRNRNKKILLKKIKFKNIINLNEINHSELFHLGKEKYSCVVDTLGGDYIKNSIKSLKRNGNYYLIGNIAGEVSNINFMPFILRAINLVGINAESTSNIEREIILKAIKKFSNIPDLSSIINTIHLNKLDNKKKIFQLNQKFGRLVVKLN